MRSAAQMAVGEVARRQHAAHRRRKRRGSDDQRAHAFSELREQLVVVLGVLVRKDGEDELVVEGLDGQQVAEGEHFAERYGTERGLVEDHRVCAEAGVESTGDLSQQTAAVQLPIAIGLVHGSERTRQLPAEEGDLLPHRGEVSGNCGGIGKGACAGGPAAAARFCGGVADAEFASLDDQGVADAHRAVDVAVAVTGEDDVREGAGSGQLQVLLEAGVGQHDPGVGSVVVLQHHLAQGVSRVGDVVARAVAGGDRVERLGAHHRGDGDPLAADPLDAYSVEEGFAVGVGGVGAHGHLVQPWLEVVRPAVISGREQVVQAGEDLALDPALAEAVVAAPFEEVTAVHDQALGPGGVEAGEHRRGRVEGRVDVGRSDDLP